jgi:hypothetical protein
VLLLQVCIQGIPWKYTEEDLGGLVAECGEVEKSEVMTSPDGRSKVRFREGSGLDVYVEKAWQTRQALDNHTVSWNDFDVMGGVGPCRESCGCCRATIRQCHVVLGG